MKTVALDCRCAVERLPNRSLTPDAEDDADDVVVVGEEEEIDDDVDQY